MKKQFLNVVAQHVAVQHGLHRVGQKNKPKKIHNFITASDVDRFSKFFKFSWTLGSKFAVREPTTPQTLPCEMSVFKNYR